MEQRDLMPCPFCGGVAEFERIGNRRQSTIISCTECGCRLENGEEWEHGSAWNTRAAIAAMPAPASPSVAEAASVFLDAYDRGMSGEKTSPDDEARHRAISLAGCFAAVAYEKGICAGQDVHALTRSFLIAMLDPTDARLDYLRSDPNSGAALRALAGEPRT